MPSSVRLGVRPKAVRMRSYSSDVILCWARSSGVTETACGATGTDEDFMAATPLLSHGGVDIRTAQKAFRNPPQSIRASRSKSSEGKAHAEDHAILMVR